jgi:hypothetical protein
MKKTSLYETSYFKTLHNSFMILNKIFSMQVMKFSRGVKNEIYRG